MNELIFRQFGKAYDSIRGELIEVGLFIGTVWAGFVLDKIGLPLEEYLALVPRTISGLPGVLAMPFVHVDLSHIFANTFPLFVLLTLLARSRAKSWVIVASIVVVSGVMSWIALAPGRYVGASALVFGLIGFLIAAGFLERRPVPLLIAIVVGFMYGWTAFVGVLPLSKTTSELAHFYGLMAGVAISYFMSVFSNGNPDEQYRS